MSANVVYEIARYDSGKDGAPLLERVQLLSVDGVLRLRDAGGSETPCEGADIAAVISSTPSLREIRAGEAVRISCPRRSPLSCRSCWSRCGTAGTPATVTRRSMAPIGWLIPPSMRTTSCCRAGTRTRGRT